MEEVIRDYLDNLMGRGIYLADEHYPKFMSLIYGNWSVDEVLEGKGQPQLHVVGSSEEREEIEASDLRKETDAP